MRSTRNNSGPSWLRSRTRRLWSAAIGALAVGLVLPLGAGVGSLAEAAPPAAGGPLATADLPIGGNAPEVPGTKTAYNDQNQAIADGSTVKPGDVVTYTIKEALIRQTSPDYGSGIKVDDVMSAGQDYVEGSLTELSGNAPGLKINEPGTTDWSGGQHIADATQWAVTNQEDAGHDPVAVPRWGENSQYVEGVSSPDKVTTPVSTGDGMNPTIGYNARGDQIAWSITHHDGPRNRIGCVLVGSRESCTSGTNFWPGYSTAQNVATISWDKTKGYMGLFTSDAIYIGGIDLSNVAPGVPPTKLGQPVQLLGDVQITGDGDANLMFRTTSIFESNGKIYVIGRPNNNNGFKLGCFDPATSAVCDGFTKNGNVVTSSFFTPRSNTQEFRVYSEINLAGGKYEFTMAPAGSNVVNVSFCVLPQGTTLVNCDGSPAPIRPSNTGNSYVSLPIVSKDPGNGIVPEVVNEGQERHRVIGWCVGDHGALAAECFDLNGASIGMPYPDLYMYRVSHTRTHDAFAYPAGTAIVVYPMEYNANRGGCYDFEKRQKCAQSPNQTNSSLYRQGVTWLDKQTVGGKTYEGELYGIRMLPGTNNCMVSLGDGNGRGVFLFWRVNPDSTITQAGNTCPQLQVNFLDQDGRYCVPGEVGMTQWGTLRLGAFLTGKPSDVRKPNQNLILDYYAYDADADVMSNILLGSVNLTDGNVTYDAAKQQFVIPKPDFLDYAATPNFTIVVRNPETATLTYAFTQEHEATGTPSICYQATVPDKCVAEGETTTLTNYALATNVNTPTTQNRSNLTKLRVVYPECHPILDKSVIDLTENPDGTWTVRYNIVVNGDPTHPTEYVLTDTPQLAQGVVIDSYLITGDPNNPAISDVRVEGTGAPTPVNNTTIPVIATPIEIPAGGEHVFTVSFVLSGLDTVAAEVRECLPADAAGHGLFNLATLTSGGLVLNDDACTDLPGLKSILELIKHVAGDESPLWTLAEPTDWTLTASDASGTAVVSGEGTAKAEVKPATYTLAEAPTNADDPALATYLPQGTWVCTAVPVTKPDAQPAARPIIDGAVQVGEGDHVSCTIVNETAHLTVLKYADPEWAATDQWSLTATPGNGAPEALTASTVPGGLAPTTGNTVSVLPGQDYTLAEALADPTSNLAYHQLALQQFVPTATTTVNGAEMRCSDALADPSAIAAGFPHPEAGDAAWKSCWADADPSIAVAANEHSILRFVNAADERPPLPLTGADSAFGAAALGLAGTLGLLAFAWRRSKLRHEPASSLLAK